MQRLKKTAILKPLLLTGVVVFAVVTSLYPNSVYAAEKQELKPGESLMRDDYILSPSREYKFIFQLDGNMVLYNKQNQAVWYSSALDEFVERLTYQHDGNLVLYSKFGRAIWSAQSYIKNPIRFTVDDKGWAGAFGTIGPNAGLDVSWSTQNSHSLSTTKTIFRGGGLLSGQGGYSLQFQSNDGNIVLYNDKHQALWSVPGTYASEAQSLQLQQDGNIVVRDAKSNVIWQSKTRYPGFDPKSNNITGGALVVQADGNLVLYKYDSGRVVVWTK